MIHKACNFHTRSFEKAMTQAIFCCLMFCLFVILSVAGCSKGSAETKVTSTQKAGTTSVEPSLSESSETTEEQMTGTSVNQLQGELEIALNYEHVDDIATNQYAVWIENSNGEYIRTLFVTSFTADGGWKERADSLAVWVERSGLGSGNAQDIDAYSGATPQSGKQTYTWDCKDENGQTVPAGEYHFLVEGTIFWEDAVLFEGVIDLGSEENTAQAQASYTTDEAKKSDMITEVSAVYRP